MKQMYYIGVDVSKGKVDIAVLNAAKEVVLEQIIKNEVKALNRFFRVLFRKLKIEKKDILVCCETTGIYNHPLEVSCTQMDIFLWVENALKIKKAVRLKKVISSCKCLTTYLKYGIRLLLKKSV